MMFKDKKGDLTVSLVVYIILGIILIAMAVGLIFPRTQLFGDYLDKVTHSFVGKNPDLLTEAFDDSYNRGKYGEALSLYLKLLNLVGNKENTDRDEALVLDEYIQNICNSVNLEVIRKSKNPDNSAIDRINNLPNFERLEMSSKEFTKVKRYCQLIIQRRGSSNLGALMESNVGGSQTLVVN